MNFKLETYSDYDFGVSSMQEYRKGTVAHMCPHCKMMNFVDCDINIDIRINTHHKEEVDISLPTFTFKCQNCGKKFTTKDQGIDPNVVDIIEMLTCAGYETEFSCEGHFGDNRYGNSVPYVTFKNSKIRKYRAPRGWKYSEYRDHKVGLFYVGVFCSEQDKEKAIDTWYNWAGKIATKEFKRRKIKKGL